MANEAGRGSRWLSVTSGIGRVNLVIGIFVQHKWSGMVSRSRFSKREKEN